MEEEAPDFYDEIYEAASGGDGTCAALVPGRSTGYEPPDDGTTEVMVGGAGPHPAPDSAASTSSAGRQGRGHDASRWKKAAPSGSTATTRLREKRGCDGAGTAVGQFSPDPTDWRQLLPFWCRHWPPYGPLGIPRDVQLQAFAEALQQCTSTMKYNLRRELLPRVTDGQSRSENPQTRFVCAAEELLRQLHNFYNWMFEQLVMCEANADSTPESLYSFLIALETQADYVESLWKWSPTEQWTCTGPEMGDLGKLFWAMDRQFIWLQVFHRWAASQYTGTPGPRRHPYWWLPPLFEDTPPFNVSEVSRNRVARDSASGMETVGDSDVSRNPVARDSVSSTETVSDSDVSNNLVASDSVSSMETVSDSVCTNGDILEGRELAVRNVSSEATAHCRSCPAQQEWNRYQKWRFPTCVVQHISMSEHEIGQLMWPEWTPIGDPESGMPVEEGDDELGAATASSQNGLDGCDGTDVNPDESSYGEHEPHVVGQQGEEQDEDIRPQHILLVPRRSGPCWGFHVVLTLHLGSEPPFLLYMKCEDRENACDLPEICTPVSSEVTVEMPRGATLPNFPHTKLSEQDMPSHRRRFTLLVPTSCMCMQRVDGS